METPPNPKSLRVAPFAVHATRGIIRDRRMRRRIMLVLVGVAVLMVIGGSTVLRAVLNPHEHAVLFLLFWVACGWLTLTALLLALLDLLSVRAAARRQRRNLREEVQADDQ